jgi:hypothetical protein
MQSSSLFINFIEKIAKPTNIFIIGLYMLSFTISVGFISEVFLLGFSAFKVMVVITAVIYIFWLFAIFVRHVIDEFVY